MCVVLEAQYRGIRRPSAKRKNNRKTYRDIDNGNDERGTKWIERWNGTSSRAESNLEAARKNHVFPDSVTLSNREKETDRERERGCL